MFIELSGEVDRRFRDGDIHGAIADLETRLAQQPKDCFKSLLGSEFSNTPKSIAKSINQFAKWCRKQFELKAIYLEMNGFDINYDLWYFDSFGYNKYSKDPEDLDWLCEWRSEEWKQVTLTGLEAVQRDFSWYRENKIYDQKEYTPAYDIALLLVMAKFVHLIEAATKTPGFNVGIPIFATAHDFDTLGRFEP